jgi:hypothetical protein
LLDPAFSVATGSAAGHPYFTHTSTLKKSATPFTSLCAFNNRSPEIPDAVHAYPEVDRAVDLALAD